VTFLSDTCENIDKHTFVGSQNIGKCVLNNDLHVWINESIVYDYNNGGFWSYLTTYFQRH
jgi:hypothetical protein